MELSKIKSAIFEVFEETAGQAKPMRLSRSAMLLHMLSLVLTVVLFVICLKERGAFFSGIDYSCHGALGWIGLWISCVWAAYILSIFVFWLFGVTPLKRPRWDYFAFGIAFLVLFLSGLSRHVPSPCIGEVLVGSAATLLLYVSLFVEKS